MLVDSRWSVTMCFGLMRGIGAAGLVSVIVILCREGVRPASKSRKRDLVWQHRGSYRYPFGRMALIVLPNGWAMKQSLVVARLAADQYESPFPLPPQPCVINPDLYSYSTDPDGAPCKQFAAQHCRVVMRELQPFPIKESSRQR